MESVIYALFCGCLIVLLGYCIKCEHKRLQKFTEFREREIIAIESIAHSLSDLECLSCDDCSLDE